MRAKRCQFVELLVRNQREENGKTYHKTRSDKVVNKLCEVLDWRGFRGGGEFGRVKKGVVSGGKADKIAGLRRDWPTIWTFLRIVAEMVQLGE